MKSKTERKVNARKYCTHLINPPHLDGEYRSGEAEGFYLCEFTNKPCIVREINDVTSRGDILSYEKPEIDEERLDYCPAHNLPERLAKAIIQDSLKKQISILEKKLRGERK